MTYKTTDGLMRHLRNNGIEISGSSQKRLLINTGYFHGYKGYRFFKNTATKLPFKTYSEIYATIQYDSDLKSLLYSKIMFIETAVKNIALESILVNADSELIQDMYDKVISSYHKAPLNFTPEQKKKLQQNKLNLQNSIQANLANAYRKNNPKITHFYNNAGYSGVPVWALFEIMTMGDFGYLLSCLTYDVRDAIAHNSVVFDTRFRNIYPTPAMKQCLKNEIKLPYVNFKTIGDYIILICYYLKMLKLSKTEIKAFIRSFEKLTDNYKTSVNSAVAAIVIHPDLAARLNILKNYV